MSCTCISGHFSIAELLFHDQNGKRSESRARAPCGDALRNKVGRGIQPWFTECMFDTGQPCYGQLTPVKTRYPLTSVTKPYRGIWFRAYYLVYCKRSSAFTLGYSISVLLF